MAVNRDGAVVTLTLVHQIVIILMCSLTITQDIALVTCHTSDQLQLIIKHRHTCC